MSISPDCNYRGDAMSITNKLNQIKNAIYGKEVRGAIHDAIKQVYDDASVNHDNANMEVKMARGTHNTLNDRLDNVDEIQAQTNAQLSHIANVYLKDFGAVCDYSTDDSQAFQRIMDEINRTKIVIILPAGSGTVIDQTVTVKDGKQIYIVGNNCSIKTTTGNPLFTSANLSYILPFLHSHC